jgi:hypothetical protein
MSDKPPPDLVLFVSATQPGTPVEIAHAVYAMFDELSVSVRLTEAAPPGYAAELAARLRAGFPGKTVTVI